MSTPLRVIDNTALNAFRACDWEYWASMVQHRRSGSSSPALHYGTVMHTLLEIFYKTRDVDVAIAVAESKYSGKAPKADDYRTLDRATLVFKEWVKTYGTIDTPADHTVGWPDAPAVELSTQVMLPRANVPYAVRIDRLVEIHGLLYVEDHKTTSQLGPFYFEEFKLSPQMMGYVRVAELLTGRKVHGVRINAICTLKGSAKFQREIIPISRDRLDDWEDQIKLTYDAIQRAHDSNTWVKRYACTRRYGKCSYFDVCSLPSDLQMLALQQDFPMSEWNPLTLHDDE